MRRAARLGLAALCALGALASGAGAAAAAAPAWAARPHAAPRADSAAAQRRIYRAPEVRIDAPRASGRGFPLARTALDPRTIGRAPSRTLSDLLATSGLVQVRATGVSGSTARIGLRGSTPDGVLVLLDGERLNGAQGGGADVAAIPLDAVDRVEIARGGASALHGGGALGGVISIIRSDSRLHDASRVAFEVGSFGLRAGTASLARRVGSASFRIVTRAARSTGTFAYVDRRRGMETLRQNAGGRSERIDLLGARPTALGALRVAGAVSRAEGGSPGPAEFPTPSARRDDARESVQARLEGARGAVAIAASRTERGYGDPDHALGPYAVRHTSRAASARAELRASGAPFAIDAGIEARFESLASTTDGRPARRAGALFGLARVDRPDGWAGSAAVRWDAVTSLAPVLSTRAGVAKELGATLARASLGTSFRPPSFDDLFWSATGFAVGNPDLRAERGVDAGVGWDLRLARGACTVALDMFAQRVEDMIVWNPGPSGIWRPSNVGRVRIHGAEASLAWNAAQAHGLPRVDASASLVAARDATGAPNTGGRDLPGRARRFAAWRVEKSLGRRVAVESSWRAVGDVPRTAANTKVIDGYVVGGAALRVAPRADLEVRLDVENLAGTEYEDYYDLPLPGRSVRVALVWADSAGDFAGGREGER
jgi:outer membrane cobalamin receptor